MERDHGQLSAQAALFQERYTRYENFIDAILASRLHLATVVSGQDGPKNLVNPSTGAISQDEAAPTQNTPHIQRRINKRSLLLDVSTYILSSGSCPRQSIKAQSVEGPLATSLDWKETVQPLQSQQALQRVMSTRSAKRDCD
ncbi:uncharacterized protein P174DRAFT_429225 [Aspergillus novofumigatus IBT 16806]|uniref:Uncharacterized protein n=1 Tax=Aspergillus novofumigatus (strain IBT 16806) TaxID=1392255 RepID=A0A2I1CJM1_ASPN1|nr:uncharacterized protein P174DRAFT_429225 [Aspergillus novofumigatus IBT 16806]PKX97820.1 hypothetical protein P174DRAFT_429225 [Aspergillus novofumigatus IBT 16806]